MKEDIVSLEGRLGELTSTLHQMIVNGQMVIIIHKIILLYKGQKLKQQTRPEVLIYFFIDSLIGKRRRR